MIRIVASNTRMETTPGGVLVFRVCSEQHYLEVQRNADKSAGMFGNIHFECDGQGWGAYDVIQSIILRGDRLLISLTPERAEDFDGRLEYEVTLPATEREAATRFLQRFFAGTNILKS